MRHVLMEYIKAQCLARALLMHCFPTVSTLGCMDFNSQNTKTMAILAGEYWVLKNKDQEIDKVGKHCKGTRSQANYAAKQCLSVQECHRSCSLAFMWTKEILNYV